MPWSKWSGSCTPRSKQVITAIRPRVQPEAAQNGCCERKLTVATQPTTNVLMPSSMFVQKAHRTPRCDRLESASTMPAKWTAIQTSGGVEASRSIVSKFLQIGGGGKLAPPGGARTGWRDAKLRRETKTGQFQVDPRSFPLQEDPGRGIAANTLLGETSMAHMIEHQRGEKLVCRRPRFTVLVKLPHHIGVGRVSLSLIATYNRWSAMPADPSESQKPVGNDRNHYTEETYRLHHFGVTECVRRSAPDWGSSAIIHAAPVRKSFRGNSLRARRRVSSPIWGARGPFGTALAIDLCH